MVLRHFVLFLYMQAIITEVNYDIEKIAEAISGELKLNNQSYRSVQHLLTDSRKVVSPEKSIFFAIKGERNNGHQFVSELQTRGVCNFVVSETISSFTNTEANFIFVENTLAALQQLAAYHRKQFNIPTIGITGSNGKTVTKEWIYQLLREDKNIVRSPKSYNSQIGVPLSVWKINTEHNLAIFEAGISKPDEMNRLEPMIKPTIGIFTNIGQAHEKNFIDIQQKITEKLRLFTSAEVLIYNKDYSSIHQQIPKVNSLTDIKLFSWSRKQKADLQIGRVIRNATETDIQGIYNHEFISIKIPFTDEASLENAIHCWALLLYLGYDNEIIAQRMELLSPVAMRLELKEGINRCSIINDSYNSDIESLTIALDFINQQKQHDKKTLILSDILQSGKDEKTLYKEVANLLNKKGINRLIGIGENISAQSHLFNLEKTFYPNTDDFLKEYNSLFFKDETILLKGARVFGFEKISHVLQQKAHETVLEINLNALIHNLNYYRSRLNSSTKIMAMVKAFSYGAGSFEIANILQFHRVSYLAVAYADEGIELRKAGINLPIIVLNPEEQSFDTMIKYFLEPEIYSFRLLSLFSKALKNHNNPSAFPIHLKLDTGMHRLGFEKDDINELIVRINNNKHIIIKSIFSHLSSSDEAEHDKYTLEQIQQFKDMADEIASHLNYKVLFHILNSAGIIRFPEAQFDMVRIGIGLYGIAPTENEQRHLENVVNLKTTISQIKNVSARDTIGYNRKGIANHDMQIATIGIGYADGLSRRLGNGMGKMLVNGKFAPTIGNICMDMCMIDITDIPSKEGDEVIVFGNEYPITTLAKDAGTIAYEILTSISQRVKRVYFQE